VGILARRAHREYRVPLRHTPLEERRSFAVTVHPYTAEEAMQEAGRCLDCHEICSICVGVCPNLAILTYESQPMEVEIAGEGEFRVGQELQVAVLTDFCNECGNCETFCPTAGAPYRDKPRLYLDRADFEAQEENAFMLHRNGDTVAMEGRWAGETHRIDLNGDLTYAAPGGTARLDPDTLAVVEGGGVPLEPAAAMYALLRGLEASVPHLPAYGDTAGGRIEHPGYEE
jgi:putative selenate reductase